MNITATIELSIDFKYKVDVFDPNGHSTGLNITTQPIISGMMQSSSPSSPINQFVIGNFENGLCSVWTNNMSQGQYALRVYNDKLQYFGYTGVWLSFDDKVQQQFASNKVDKILLEDEEEAKDDRT